MTRYILPNSSYTPIEILIFSFYLFLIINKDMQLVLVNSNNLFIGLVHYVQNQCGYYYNFIFLGLILPVTF